MIEVADNPRLANPALQTLARGGSGSALSIAYAGLGNGRWFWRASPVFTDEYQGTIAPSALASFSIAPNGALEAPALLTPRAEAALNIASADRGDIYFSWKNEPEADSYTLLISGSEDLQNPLLARRTTVNHAVYGASEPRLAEGRYYWGAYQTDGAGDVSAISPPRAFAAVAGTAALRPPPPPAAPETSATPEAPPTSPARATPPVEQPPPRPPAPPPTAVPAAPVERPQPPTPPPLLPEPLGRLPANGYSVGPAQLREFRVIRFSWNAVPGADSYIFVLYKDERGTRRLIQRWASPRNSHDLSELSLLENGRFIWEVEAVNQAGSGPVQRGKPGENYFTVDIPPIRRQSANSPGAAYGL
jgi:hypothetical protein